MRKHQRYLPVRTADGALMRHFVTMANGDCDDDLVRVGNENVLRARYEDAAFFYAADLKVPLADLRAGIAKLTFEERVGSMADRADRIRDVAAASPSTSRSTCRRARRCPGRASWRSSTSRRRWSSSCPARRLHGARVRPQGR